MRGGGEGMEEEEWMEIFNYFANPLLLKQFALYFAIHFCTTKKNIDAHYDGLV